MPECPEVSSITDQLYNYMKSSDSVLESVKILSGRYMKHGPPDDWLIFKDNLPLKWCDVQSKGKFIYFTFVNKYGDLFYMWNTLAMTGTWTIEKDLYSRIFFSFGDKNLYFNDKRNFGTIKFSFNELPSKLLSLGPSWLGVYDGTGFRNIDVCRNEFLEKFGRVKSKNICTVLMDQSVFSGIGNYLLSEVLHDSGNSPFNSVGDTNLESLYDSIVKIVNNSYRLDGVSMSDYKGIDGEKGEYQRYLKVYGKKCPEVVKEIGPHGRSVYWIPS